MPKQVYKFDRKLTWNVQISLGKGQTSTNHEFLGLRGVIIGYNNIIIIIYIYIYIGVKRKPPEQRPFAKAGLSIFVLQFVESMMLPGFENCHQIHWTKCDSVTDVRCCNK